MSALPITPTPTPEATGAEEPLEAALLADIAAGLAAAEGLWRPHAHHQHGDRRPIRLVAADQWEAWVIGWTEGQRVELHDHGRSAAAVVVVEGQLTDITLHDGGEVLTVLSAGDSRSLPVGTIHDIVAPGEDPATSIHVYSPPLSTMTFYDDRGRPTRASWVDDDVPMTDLRTATMALHPSRSRGPRG